MPYTEVRMKGEVDVNFPLTYRVQCKLKGVNVVILTSKVWQWEDGYVYVCDLSSNDSRKTKHNTFLQTQSTL